MQHILYKLQLISLHVHWPAWVLMWWRTSIMCAMEQMPTKTERFCALDFKTGWEATSFVQQRLSWKPSCQLSEVVITQNKNIPSSISCMQKPRSQLWHNWCQMCWLCWSLLCGDRCAFILWRSFGYLYVEHNLLWSFYRKDKIFSRHARVKKGRKGHAASNYTDCFLSLAVHFTINTS